MTADPRVASLILARLHTFVEIDHEITSMVIFLLPLIQEGLLSVTSVSMVNRLVKVAQEKSVVMWTDCLDTTMIAVDWDIKNQTKPKP